MAFRRLPTAWNAFRFDPLAQLGAYSAAIFILTPLVIAVQDGEDAPSAIVVPMLVVGVVALVAFIVRLVLMRRSYAAGDEVVATVAEVRSAMASMKTIVYDYPVGEETRRRTYTVSEKLLYAVQPGSSLRLIVPKGNPDRPFIRDLYD